MVFWAKKSATGFSKSSTADQVTEGIDATGLTAFVTGGTNGIGKETVRTLCKRGAHVVVGARNTERAEKVKEEILKETPDGKLDIVKLDTSVLESVRTAVDEFLELNLPLNILVNNAGIAYIPFKKSEDGIELQFATNYLGHFLLTNLLLDKMEETAKESGIQGRIINVSSLAHSVGVTNYKEGIRFEKLNDNEGYNKYRAYGQSKLSQVIATKELSDRLQAKGANVTVNVLHPGIVKTNIASDNRVAQFFFGIISCLSILKTPQQGAATQCYLALHPGAKGVSGKYYFDDVNERASPSRFVNDKELANKLWDFSLKLTCP